MLSATATIRYNLLLLYTNGYGYGYGYGYRHRHQQELQRPASLATIIRCSSSDSNKESRASTASERKGKSKGKDKGKGKGASSPLRNSTYQSQQSGSLPSKAPGIISRMDGASNSITSDLQFEERLEAVRRSALDQKKAEEKKLYGAIDYDAPIASEPSRIGFGTKIGVGVAVVVFGLVFALGDFLPSGSVNPKKDETLVKNTLAPEEKAKLETRLQQYEATLKNTPEDPVALEGAAVTLTELGDYARATSMLEDLTKEKSSDPEAFRLLGDVKYELKDYEGSVAAYRSSAMVSKKMNFEVLRGLTNALLAAKKPDEAVQILLSSRDSLGKEKVIQANIGADGSAINTNSQLDPIQVDLLLGKAYSDWGHVSDAVSVYDQLISSHPDDFRGYLAKGIILKRNGKLGDAERMFIQARFFAPEGAKAIVDRYSRE